MRVNVAIVAYENTVLMLEAAVESVLNEKEIIHRFYMIDNSPTDRLRKNFESKVEYLYSNKNLGFGKANNIAIEKSLNDGIEYHLLVNPDIHFEKGVVSRMVAYMDAHPNVGMLAPKVVYPDGSTQYLCKLMPSPIDLIGRRFFGWGPFKKMIDRRNDIFELRNSGYNKSAEVPILSGSFVMLRTSVLEKVGMFDERFFLYLEDFDLCRRIGNVSETVFYPDVQVVHEYERGSYFHRRLFGHHVVSAVKYFTKWGWFFDETRKQRNEKCLSGLEYPNDL